MLYERTRQFPKVLSCYFRDSSREVKAIHLFSLLRPLYNDHNSSRSCFVVVSFSIIFSFFAFLFLASYIKAIYIFRIIFVTL